MTELGKDGIVRFTFFRPGVREVAIATDGTGWQPSYAMASQGDGWWTAAMPLPTGEHRFRYLADGQWFADYASNGVERATPNDGWTSILVVPQSEANAAATFAM